jgi:hypothetical protein
MVPILETTRTSMAAISGDKATKTRSASAIAVIEAIEQEGWHLEHAGYVFQQTGSVSRDKLMSSGQTAAVMGSIVGIYLFRRKADPSAEPDRPD